MNRIFNREEFETSEFIFRDKLKIGVAGMGRAAGCTFIATALAAIFSADKERCTGFADVFGYLSRSNTDKRMLYDILGMDRRFSVKEYTDLFALAEQEESIRGKRNIERRINWAAPSGEYEDEDKKLPDEALLDNALKVINNLYADIIICDIGKIKDIQMKAFLNEMDVMIYVIDPLPSKLIGGFASYSLIRKAELKAKEKNENRKFIYVLNKMNAGVDRREMLSYLRLKNYFEIPYFPTEYFYEAEYNCKIPFETAKLKKLSFSQFDKIHKSITQF